MKTLDARSVDLNILITAIFYYLAAEAGYFLQIGNSPSLPIWPPAGIALALVVLQGRKVWPGIAIGSLVITLKNYWLGAIGSVQALMLVSAIISASRVAEALAGEFLFRKLIKKPYPFSATLDAFYFAFVSLSISLISSSVSALVLWPAGVVPATGVTDLLFADWTRNVVGILLFAPPILAIRSAQFTVTPGKIGEMVLFVSSFMGMLFMFNLKALHSVLPLALPFLVIPFLLWLAFRFQVITCIAGILSASLAATYFTSIQQGPFAVPATATDSILLLQVYIGVICISTLVLASAVQERQKAQLALLKFTENLEALVHERTKALEDEIANRKQAQMSLQESNGELVKRNSELDRFAYSVSHDLRAPIASILGLINLMRKEKSRSNQDLVLEMMEKSANQQDSFIKEILDQSRNTRLEVKREPVMFEPLILEAFQQHGYQSWSEARMKAIVSVEQSEPFYCDKWRLKLILNNVISNAIRYKNGRDPEIKVDARFANNRVNLVVQDNGRGIKQEHIRHLGQMFYRATDEGAGAGLGLYIVKEALQKLNGSFAIESEEGQGTTVRFDIPEVRT